MILDFFIYLLGAGQEAVAEAIEAQCVVMKYASFKKPSMLHKDFCAKAHMATMSKSGEVVNFVMRFTPVEYWSHTYFCVRMFTEFPAPLDYAPERQREITRRF